MRMIIAEHRSFLHRIGVLVKLDLTRTYRGALLGWLWAFVQPLILLFVYWFVLHVGLRATVTPDYLSSLSWLLVGLVSWLCMSDMINKGATSMRTYKHLVTKMKFPVSVIPTFVSLSRMVVHVLLLTVVLLYIGIFGEGVRITWLQLPLYTFMMFIFFTAWSLFAAPLAAISKDFENIVKSTVRVLFWVSGILWNVRMLDAEWIRTLLLFNPITFFVEGYRNAVLYGTWFWEDTRQLAVFGAMLVVMVALAAITYTHTRKELADIL
jgi:teichoic acid transport system permease protein